MRRLELEHQARVVLRGTGIMMTVSKTENRVSERLPKQSLVLVHIGVDEVVVGPFEL